MVRDPVQRMNSLYNYFCIDKAEGYHQIIPEKERNSLGAFVRNIDKYTLVHGNNAQTRLIAGAKLHSKWDDITDHQSVTDKGMLEKAIYNIETHFDCIGTTERFAESLVLFKKYLCWEKPLFFIKRNKTRNRSNEITQETLELIREKNWADIKLYEHVNNNLVRQIEKNDEYIKREIKKLDFNATLYKVYRNNIRRWIKI
jgi:hypothetical protein